MDGRAPGALAAKRGAPRPFGPYLLGGRSSSPLVGRSPPLAHRDQPVLLDGSKAKLRHSATKVKPVRSYESVRICFCLDPALRTDVKQVNFILHHVDAAVTAEFPSLDPSLMQWVRTASRVEAGDVWADAMLINHDLSVQDFYGRRDNGAVDELPYSVYVPAELNPHLAAWLERRGMKGNFRLTSRLLHNREQDRALPEQIISIPSPEQLERAVSKAKPATAKPVVAASIVRSVIDPVADDKQWRLLATSICLLMALLLCWLLLLPIGSQSAPPPPPFTPPPGSPPSAPPPAILPPMTPRTQWMLPHNQLRSGALVVLLILLAGFLFWQRRAQRSSHAAYTWTSKGGRVLRVVVPIASDELEQAGMRREVGVDGEGALAESTENAVQPSPLPVREEARRRREPHFMPATNAASPPLF
jgi:hypothetical protein